MSAEQDEFLPLIAPRVTTAKTPVSLPVNWFTRIAPQLPDAMSTPEPAPSELPQTESGIASRAIFQMVEEVAAAERRMQMASRAEPPEIARMRLEAQQAAHQLIQQAHIQVNVLAEEARNEGYQQGYERGYADGEREAIQTETQRAEAERAACREDLAAFVALIEAERKRAWAEMEPQIIEMIFELAKQVIKQEVKVSYEPALSVIRNVLRRVADAGTLRIRVNAEDLEAVRGDREELLNLVDNIRHIEIIDDRRVGKGGCIVETGAGNIDARIETQLDEIGATIGEMLKSSGQ